MYKLILFVSFLYADSFYISFQYATKDYKEIYSKFNCSKALSKFKRGEFLFSLPCNEKKIIKFCYKNKEILIDKLLKKDIIFISRDKIYNTYIQTHKKLTFLPHKFDIIIKNDKIYFYEGIE